MSSNNESSTSNSSQLPPETVREVAKKVYKLWLRDLQILKERKRTQGRSVRRHNR